jgi:hypothetical protein
MSKTDHRNTRTRKSDRRRSSEAKTLSFIFSNPDSSSSRMPELILEILVIVLLSTPGISPSSVTEGPRSRYCYNDIVKTFIHRGYTSYSRDKFVCQICWTDPPEHSKYFRNKDIWKFQEVQRYTFPTVFAVPQPDKVGNKYACAKC